MRSRDAGMTECLLDNVAWHALCRYQARYSEGTDDARRYARGFSSIIGFAAEHTSFSAVFLALPVLLLAVLALSGMARYADGNKA